MVRAASTGNITLICELLQCGVPANSYANGHTPLGRAASKGHVNVAKLLLVHNAPVDDVNRNKNTPLYIASRNGYTEVVKLLLTYHASTDKAGQYSNTPLYVASLHGYTEVVRLLLIYNASVDKVGKYRNTPLYAASLHGYEEVVKLLLINNASVNISNKHGLTPLHAAVVNDRYVIVELLCHAGAHVNAQTHKLYAIKGVIIAARSTALHIAVRKRNTIIVKLLIYHKAELLKDRNGLTAINISRKQKSTDITEQLQGI